MQAHCEMQPPDGVKVALSGALTLQRAGELRDLLAEQLAAADRLTLDLGAVVELDATAIQLLIAAFRKARSQDKQLELAATPAAALHQLCARLGFVDSSGPADAAEADLFRRLGA
jgi:anti-sigma B factor antagonist